MFFKELAATNDSPSLYAVRTQTRNLSSCRSMEMAGNDAEIVKRPQRLVWSYEPCQRLTLRDRAALDVLLSVLSALGGVSRACNDMDGFTKSLLELETWRYRGLKFDVHDW